jgi:hypothetical protein
MKNILFLFLLFELLCCDQNDGKLVVEIYNKNDKQSKIQNMIVDTLNNWCINSVAQSKQLLHHEWHIDSSIVFNIDSNLIYTTVNTKLSGFKSATIDDISDLGGAKINGKWYFFFMNVSMPVERALYQDSIYAPYTFNELSYIAHKHRFSQVVDWSADGKYKVKEAYFIKNFYNAISKDCMPAQSNRHCFDSIVVKLNKDYYTHKLSKEEINEISKAMSESLRPPEPKIETSFWEKIFGREKKLFESKEWKKYLKKKYKP